MNAMSAPISFEPAYRQLQHAERSFVDAFIIELEQIAIRHNERLGSILRTHGPEIAKRTWRAHDMLSRPLVKSAVVERVEQITRDNELNAYKTLKEVQSIAYSNMGDYMDFFEDGSIPVFNFGKCTPEQLSAVRSVKFKQKPDGGFDFEFQLHDKMAALEKLMRYQGLAEADSEHFRAQNTKVVQTEALAADVDDDGAADHYSRIINGA